MTSKQKISRFFETCHIRITTNLQKAMKSDMEETRTIKTNSYLKPAWTHNSSVRTDLPLTVIGKAGKKKIMEIINPGQLLCVGEVYLKTHDGLIRIK